MSIDGNKIYKLFSDYSKACVNYTKAVEAKKKINIINDLNRLRYKCHYDILKKLGEQYISFLIYMAENREDILINLSKDDISVKNKLIELSDAYMAGYQTNLEGIIESYTEDHCERDRKGCFKAVFKSEFFKDKPEFVKGSYANILSILLKRTDTKFNKGIRRDVYTEEIGIHPELIKMKLVKIEKKKAGFERIRVRIPQSVVNQIAETEEIGFIADCIKPNIIIKDVETDIEYLSPNTPFQVQIKMDHDNLIEELK